MILNDENQEAINILLAKYEENLSDWEIQFLETIQENEWISEKQQEILNKIWEREIK